MKIPKSVMICGFRWGIKTSAEVAIEGDVFGSCHYQSQVLYLDPKTTDQKREQCLLHEIMHAISWQTGLAKRINDRKLEEEILTALSFGLYQVLKDNGFLK